VKLALIADDRASLNGKSTSSSSWLSAGTSNY